MTDKWEKHTLCWPFVGFHFLDILDMFMSIIFFCFLILIFLFVRYVEWTILEYLAELDSPPLIEFLRMLHVIENPFSLSGLCGRHVQKRQELSRCSVFAVDSHCAQR